MNFLVTLLAILAAAKIGAKEFIHRSAATEVIFAAYSERAADACFRDARAQALIISERGFLSGGPAQVVIGKPSVPVFFWQTEHAQWNARYRNPYLHLSSETRGVKLACEYDIVNGAASVRRM